MLRLGDASTVSLCNLGEFDEVGVDCVGPAADECKACCRGVTSRLSPPVVGAVMTAPPVKADLTESKDTIRADSETLCEVGHITGPPTPRVVIVVLSSPMRSSSWFLCLANCGDDVGSDALRCDCR